MIQSPRRKRVEDIGSRLTVSASWGGVNFMVHKKMVMMKENIDGSVPVCSTHENAAPAKRAKHFGVGMTEEVVSPAGDHCQTRPHCIEKRRRRRSAAPVVRYLQNIGTNRPGGQQRLPFALRISGEESRSCADRRAQHHGTVVFRRAPERAIWNDRPNVDRADAQRVAVANEMNRNARFSSSLQQ